MRGRFWILFLLSLNLIASGKDELTVIQPVPTGEALINPGMGWVYFHYTLFISVGKPDGTPVIALPLAGDDGKRRYRIGTIEVE